MIDLLLKWLNTLLSRKIESTEVSSRVFPKKIALHLTEKETGKPLKNIGIMVGIQYNKTTIMPLGKLGTDHVGYVSFDCSDLDLNLNQVVDHIDKSYFQIIASIKTDNPVQIIINEEYFKGIFYNTIYAEIQVDANSCKNFSISGLLSMQNPTIEDWKLSPNSFAINPSFFIGQDNCENLYSANFAISEYNFFQIIRGNISINEEEDIQTGWILNYKTSWLPLGHSLGKILNSVSLAPAEKVKIAVINWSRESSDSRTEDTQFNERLTHTTHRDRSINETIEASLHEYQRGYSVTGGVSDSAGLAIGDGTLGVSAGSARSLGGGYSSTEANRETSASTVQELADNFSQTSSAMREFRSSVVVLSNQQESTEAKTRLIVNYNHSHTLNILYYEVLRHFKVTTKAYNYKPCVLVKMPTTIDLEENEQILKYQKILRGALRDKSLLGCFDVIKSVVCKSIDIEEEAENIANFETEFTSFTLVFTTADTIVAGTNSNIRFRIILNDGTKVDCKRSSNRSYNLHSDGNSFERSDIDRIRVIPDSVVLWKDIKAFEITLEDIGSDLNQGWSCESFTVTGRDNNDATTDLLTYSNDFVLDPEDGAKRKTVEQGIKKPVKGKLNSLDLICCYKSLKKHIKDFNGYYQRVIWFAEDANDRAVRIKDIEVNGKKLIDLIINRPIDVWGDYLVFPASKDLSDGKHPDKDMQSKDERLITLPTQGVFADAKLGHCNVSEVIDDTRFWDWQISPIPDDAPQIDGLNINESRNQDVNTNPTSFPSAIVNIQQPSNAPDPTGLQNALNLLGQKDIFRNMSMSNEVEDLLEKLSDNSVSMAEKANAVRSFVAKNKGSNSSSSGSGSERATSSNQSISPRRAQNEIQVSENQRNNGVIDEAAHRENVDRAIGKMQGEGNNYTSITNLEPIVNFGSNADKNAVSDYAIEVLKSILTTSGLQSATITSTARTVEDQARIMYDNCLTFGSANQKALYATSGDQVIDVFITGVTNGNNKEQIITNMAAKINELGPSTVSRHINADPGNMSVFDVAPSTIANKLAFIAASKSNTSVTKFLEPPNDPAYHFEIPEPSLIV